MGVSSPSHDPLDETELLRQLPPMLEPNHNKLIVEIIVGVFLISVVDLILEFVLHFTLMQLQFIPWPGLCLLHVLVCLGGLLAIICWVVIMHKDPGWILRSPRTCLPFPDEIVHKFKAGDNLDNVANLAKPNGDSFCARCFVWRKIDEPQGFFQLFFRDRFVIPSAPPHHCSTCNRCVQQFDHHCKFLGRCIAGRGCQGNFLWFLVLCLLCILGLLLECVLLVIFSLHHWGRRRGIGIIICVVWVGSRVASPLFNTFNRVDRGFRNSCFMTLAVQLFHKYYAAHAPVLKFGAVS